MSKRIPWGPDSPGYPNCPVPAGHDVTVWFRGGGKARDDNPEGWTYWWRHDRRDEYPDYDIIAYCDHDAPDEARELLVEAQKALNVAVKLAPLLRLITIRDVIAAGEDAIDACGLNPWCVKEGLAIGDEQAIGEWKLEGISTAHTAVTAYLERTA